jgi:hypothetical protein
MARSVPAGLELAFACCAWPPSAPGDQRVQAAAEAVNDWAEFGRIVQRNHIMPLVHSALTRANVLPPADIRAEFSERAAKAARRAIDMAFESLRLQSTFDSAALPLMVIKGIPLGCLAYGDFALKESVDIDILVHPDNVVRAKATLHDLGYEMHPRKVDGSAFEQFVEHGKEAAFVNRQKRLLVELHWRLTGFGRPLRGVDVNGPSQQVSLPGGTLKTLANEPLFAFLCLHGETHNWSRLKWLADVNAFAARQSPGELERLYRAAQALGVGRSASVALRLCHSLLGLPLGESLAAALDDTPVTRALTWNALGGLKDGGGGREHRPYTFTWLRVQAAQFLLGEGLGHIRDQANALWNSPEDRARLPLPRRLGFLYHVLRVPMWATRNVSRIVRQAATRPRQPRAQ